MFYLIAIYFLFYFIFSLLFMVLYIFSLYTGNYFEFAALAVDVVKPNTGLVVTACNFVFKYASKL